MQTNELPVAIIGGGPVGLAAAAHLLERGLRPVVFEAGPQVGHAMRDWGHVRMFSPWRYVVDHASKRMLSGNGWVMPDEETLPTGLDLVEQYLEPLAALPAIRSAVRLGTRVAAVSRQFVDKVKTPQRDAMPFVVRTIDAEGVEHDVLASAVIDASGTWFKANPMGANGLPARGETAHAARMRYGIPDILGKERARYAGKRTLVVGTGHSAINSLLALVELMDQDERTRVFWGMRRRSPGNAFGGGGADALPARGALGARLRAQVDEGNVRILTGLQIGAVQENGGTLVVSDVNGNEVALVDEVIVATGARPDLELLREMRLDLDAALESPRVLGPLIDPNEHSCGSVRPHGAFELEQPERGLFIVGMKSYGRAPTFLLATGYEQVRSVAAYIAGDYAAAREVLIDLPETGVCNVTFGVNEASAGCCGAESTKEADMTEVNAVADQQAACCGGPAPKEADACCVKDADAKAAGESGCGCNTPKPATKSAPEAAASSCCG
ncbi:MAG: NAD(P)-binding domain-containing protein [Acidobacteriota bacterium]|nr:NAD(P)-binding domain-containing protein [Acidobacteriota bacterium]